MSSARTTPGQRIPFELFDRIVHEAAMSAYRTGSALWIASLFLLKRRLLTILAPLLYRIVTIRQRSFDCVLEHARRPDGWFAQNTRHLWFNEDVGEEREMKILALASNIEVVTASRLSLLYAKRPHSWKCPALRVSRHRDPQSQSTLGSIALIPKLTHVHFTASKLLSASALKFRFVMGMCVTHVVFDIWIDAESGCKSAISLVQGWLRQPYLKRIILRPSHQFAVARVTNGAGRPHSPTLMELFIQALTHLAMSRQDPRIWVHSSPHNCLLMDDADWQDIESGMRLWSTGRQLYPSWMIQRPSIPAEVALMIIEDAAVDAMFLGSVRWVVNLLTLSRLVMPVITKVLHDTISVSDSNLDSIIQKGSHNDNHFFQYVRHLVLEPEVDIDLALGLMDIAAKVITVTCGKQKRGELSQTVSLLNRWPSTRRALHYDFVISIDHVQLHLNSFEQISQLSHLHITVDIDHKKDLPIPPEVAERFPVTHLVISIDMRVYDPQVFMPFALAWLASRRLKRLVFRPSYKLMLSSAMWIPAWDGRSSSFSELVLDATAVMTERQELRVWVDERPRYRNEQHWRRMHEAAQGLAFWESGRQLLSQTMNSLQIHSILSCALP
ncbi:hypothetical protein BKA62DRAFT_702179 [Auriculariales sp. MPI-PUGE-AT-0066]|nr:hypothetical protein BKA62DRAFT_702179 [Auriculariales sp. MPI-PUGE-AT-0066]